MRDIQYQMLSYDECDKCGTEGACVAITTFDSDFVFCVPCARAALVEV